MTEQTRSSSAVLYTLAGQIQARADADDLLTSAELIAVAEMVVVCAEGMKRMEEVLDEQVASASLVDRVVRLRPALAVVRPAP